MSKLNVDQKTINDLLSNNRADFLIPDYQRPYAWDAQEECLTLWEDVFAFAIPDCDASKFNTSSEYYLGPIVTFKNEKEQMEIIDGQQRLTTIMLLLRAFYSCFEKMQDDESKQLKAMLGCCIWKTDEFNRPNMTRLKINSEVATDNDKEEFLSILKTGEVDAKMKSRYASNYRFFQEQIDKFKNDYPTYIALFAARILNNCILLPIEADVQDTALRIFSTLNNRGKPLSDADIFKAELYKFYSSKNQKDSFIERWRTLENICESTFHPKNATPMDELFARYMYFERAKKGDKNTTTGALRSFYSADNYRLLKTDETLTNMEFLADFWDDVEKQNNERFSHRVLCQLFVLNYAPNSMWTFFVSVYFLKNRDANNQLEDEKFYRFLRKTIAFVWVYAITNPGVNALRVPIYPEMINIVNGDEVSFAQNQFPEGQTRNQFENFNFLNRRPITRSMLIWWMMSQPNQTLPKLEKFDIEHIFAKKRYEIEKTLSDATLLEKLGNKAILETNINIKASDYAFYVKTRYYKGEISKKPKPTLNQELLNLANSKNDFTEADILARDKEILDKFFEYLRSENLLKQ